MACGNNRFSCIFSVNLHVVKASTKDYNLQKFSICREKLKEVRSGSRRFTGRTDPGAGEFFGTSGKEQNNIKTIST